MSASQLITMGSSSSTDAWINTYQQIKHKHDAAYQAIQEAITLEEQERPLDAIEQYTLGICLIDQSLKIPVSCPETTDSTWGEACQMIQKLKRTRGEVLTRITCIQNSPDYISRHCPPPSYEEAMSESSSTNASVSEDVPRTYNELAAALQDLQIESSVGTIPKVILSVEYARLYFISPDGTVVSTSEPEILTISTTECHGTSATPNQSIREAFIQVGDWVYPLLPGVSPCIRTEYGAFIVPDVNSPVNGSSVGIIIPEHAYEAVYDLLENILHGIVNTPASAEQRRQRDIRPLVPSEEVLGAPGNKVSSAILTGAYYISKGLIYGAEKASTLINYGTPKIINHIEPAHEVTQVNRKVRQGFILANNATNKAATATGFVADKVGLATSRLGQYLAPHIQKQGTKLLSSGFNLSEAEASTKVSGVLTVAAGAVEGFATVYRGLETSAGILGQNLKNNSVKIVKHKYGPAAGELSNETLETLGNVITIGQNTHVLKPRKILKNIAKSTVTSIQSDGVGVAGPSGIPASSALSALPGLKSTSSGSFLESHRKETGDKEKQKFLEQEQVVNAMLHNNSVGDPDLDFNSDDLININWSTSAAANKSIEKRE